MLPSSLHRVVTSGRPAAAGLTASVMPRTTSVVVAAAAAASTPLVLCGHQRRLSSSKPSRSDNGSSESPARDSVHSSPPSEGKATGDKRKRKNKDKDSSSREASFKKLPSVPNTNHMSRQALGLSSFFSLYRPISIGQLMPRTVTDAHFASIFASRSKAERVAESMSTFTDTINQLEEPMAQMTIGGQDEHSQNGVRLEFRNDDGSESGIHLQVNAMSGIYLPFSPPPTPQPQSIGEAETNNADESQVSEQTLSHRVFKALFTIEESTQANGEVRIIAHSPRIINEDQPRSFLERMAQRQLRFDEARARRASGDADDGSMQAISVQRQRKLKMKKHKYKKLRKRTRALRRKLENK